MVRRFEFIPTKLSLKPLFFEVPSVLRDNIYHLLELQREIIIRSMRIATKINQPHVCSAGTFLSNIVISISDVAKIDVIGRSLQDFLTYLEGTSSLTCLQKVTYHFFLFIFNPGNKLPSQIQFLKQSL